MLCVVDAHAFGNTRLVFVSGFNFPAFFQLTQRETIWRIAINFIRRSKNEWRFRANVSHCFQQVQRAIGIDGEIRLRIARRPVVRRLRRGMHNGTDCVAVLLE